MLSPVAVFAAPLECECVRALRELRGVDVRGNADTLNPNTTLADVQTGDVLLMRYGSVYHAALVTSVYSEGKALEDGSYHTRPVRITIWEANYSSCKIITRVLSIEDSHIRGILRTV